MEVNMSPAEYQSILLDYLQVSATPKEAKQNMLSEFSPDLEPYIQSWKEPQIALAMFLLEKWGVQKNNKKALTPKTQVYVT
jgi:hypothetical protein